VTFHTPDASALPLAVLPLNETVTVSADFVRPKIGKGRSRCNTT
jgi:hypothetical protein